MGNGVCDAMLNTAVCEWDGGDCCSKTDGSDPDLSLCTGCECGCLDPAKNGPGDNAKCGCQDKAACNYDEEANMGEAEQYCRYREKGFNCEGKCIDSGICGRSFTMQPGCCRDFGRDKLGYFKDIASALIRQDCRAACNKDKNCTGFEWQQGLRKCRTFYRDQPTYGETACAEGADIECWMDDSGEAKCVKGAFSDGTLDSFGQDCSAYAKHPEFCGSNSIGYYDTDKFKASRCCVCQPLECKKTNHENEKDFWGKGCGDYDKNPEKYCYDGKTRDSFTFSYTSCCACPTRPDKIELLPPPPPNFLGLTPEQITIGLIAGSALLVVLTVSITVACCVTHHHSEKESEERKLKSMARMQASKARMNASGYRKQFEKSQYLPQQHHVTKCIHHVHPEEHIEAVLAASMMFNASRLSPSQNQKFTAPSKKFTASQLDLIADELAFEETD